MCTMHSLIWPDIFNILSDLSLTTVLVELLVFHSTTDLKVASKLSRLVMSDSGDPWTRLLSAWNSPGQNIGVGSLFLLQGIFWTQASNPGLPRCRRILYRLSHQVA